MFAHVRLPNSQSPQKYGEANHETDDLATVPRISPPTILEGPR
jgi:hypothetical protein